jgi:hypothetical protein
MRALAFLFIGFWAALSTAGAQVEFISDNYFPADLEFQELRKVASGETFEDPARLSKVDDGLLFSKVGFDKYSSRVYNAANSGSLTVEVVTLRDARAAYSALTLLRSGPIQNGPPGDFFTISPDGIGFSQAKEWVRIHGRGTAEGLPRRVAMSISNRIGPRQPKPPSLVAHLPKNGYDASSLHYYPGIQAYEAFPEPAGAKGLRLSSDAEIAQARYSLDDGSGTLSLLKFPTGPLAEGFFDELSSHGSAEKDSKVYTKRAGPIVGILEGRFDPPTADKILNSIQFSYSVRWIYEKPKPKTVWGVPVVILGTVVKSLLFVVLLCGVSIVLGIGAAIIKFLTRAHASKNSPDHPERGEIIRLRMR